MRERHSNTAANMPAINPISATRSQADEPSKRLVSVTEDEIRVLAFQKWERAGRPNGDGVGFWLEAEMQLINENLPSGSRR